MSTEAQNLNTITSNAWLAIIPTKIIEPGSEDEFRFNLGSFNFAGLILGTAEISKYGETFPIPSKSVDSDKIVTFRYKPDSEWAQYEFLFSWFDRQQNNKHGEYEDYNEWINSSMVDVKVYLLNEYKKSKLKWTFRNCWLKEFGELDMIYDSDGGGGIDHGFSLQYHDFDFERVDGEL